MTDTWADLQARLDYTFRDPLLMRTAMTHSSYLNEAEEPTEDNQRLEYLGDAVLDFTIAEVLYHAYPEAHEGDLTRWRAQLVSTDALAAKARELALGEALLVGHGEDMTGGHQRPANLAATLEAVVAAIYLDGGWDAVKRFVRNTFAEEIRRVTAATGPQDARSRLQELAQSRLGITPRYHTVGESGPDHARLFTVQVFVGSVVRGEGKGRSKRAAAQAAAEEALARLEAQGDGLTHP